MYLHLLWLVHFQATRIEWDWYIPRSVGNTLKMRDTIKKERIEVDKLHNQKQIIAQYESYNLPNLTTFVQKLISDNDDTFSIHTTIDTMVADNNFIDTTKKIPNNEENIGVIPITLTTEASIDTLSKILENHLYRYGRFFTIQSVTYDFKNSKITLKMNFFSSGINKKLHNLSKLNPPNDSILTELQKFQKNQLPQFSVTSTQSESDDYAKTQLPFGTTNKPISIE